ncbi:MAG: hypothetical protein Q3968_07495 [Clostridiaceae bacterium]|nr:hypothetical protein [Clostridiaceae bacterium]
MLIAIIGENCSGKSTLAEKIKDSIGAEIISGKDYLRMAKSESEATVLFKEKLSESVNGENIVYVITQAEHLALLPEAKHGSFEGGEYDYRYEGVNGDADALCEELKARSLT